MYKIKNVNVSIKKCHFEASRKNFFRNYSDFKAFVFKMILEKIVNFAIIDGFILIRVLMF